MQVKTSCFKKPRKVKFRCFKNQVNNEKQLDEVLVT